MSLAKCLAQFPVDADDLAEIGKLNETLGDESKAVESFAQRLNSELDGLHGQLFKKGYGVTAPVVADAGAASSGTARKVAADIATGIVEAPIQAIGGVADAFNAVIGLGDIMQEMVPLPGARIFDRDGNFSPAIVSADDVTAEMNARGGKAPGVLPTTDAADTKTGGIIRSVGQFVAGYAMGGKLFGPAVKGARGAFVARSTAQGLFSDVAAFDGHEQRLSNLVQSVPALANPVTEFLAADPGDTEAMGRLKNGLEGLLPDTLLSGVLTGLKAVRQARTVKAATGANSYTKAADALADRVKAGDIPASGTGDVFRAIGDSSSEAPLVTRAGEKLRASTTATDTFTADGALTGMAAEAVTKTTPPVLPKEPVGETFINFARINTGDDIKAVLKDLADSFPGEIGKAQRGVRSNVETVSAASGKYDEVWTGLLERGAGKLGFNAEQQFAMRQMWTSSGEKLLETARLAEGAPTAENLLSFRKMLTIHNLVQNQAMAVRTETARALQQWSIPVGAGGRDKINAMQAILLQHGGADVNIDLVRKFAGLAEEVAANPKNMVKVIAATEKAAGATTLNAVNEAWIGLGLLSGPKTHLRNMISNMGMMASSVAEKAVASRAQGLIDDRTAIEIGEASAQVAGIFGNVRQAWFDAADTFKSGQMKQGMSQLDIPPEMAMRSFDQNTLFGKSMYGLSYAPMAVFRGLQASDQFFKTLNYSGEIRALATRDAIRAARDGVIKKDGMADRVASFIANPPKSAIDEAMETSARRTFTNEPGKLTKYILRGRNEFPLSRFVIPFVNTPANVFRTSIEYSPLAPALTKYREAIARGGPDAALARTRMGIGTSAMMAFTDLSMDGKITGSGPEPGSAEYAALKRTGWKPYTVKIGDKWVSYRGIDPFSTVMGIGADIGDYLRYSENDPDSVESMKDMLAVGVFSVADQALDRAFLSGMANMMRAVMDPEQYGSQWVDSFASSFVPRGLTEVRYQNDTTVRDARGMMDSLKNKIPYMSMAVPEKRDEWGRTLSSASGWGTAYDTLSPFAATQQKVEPIDRELIRQGFGAGSANRAMTLDNVSVSLTNRADIYNRYLELRGQSKASDLDPKLAEKYGDKSMLDVLNGMVTGDHPLAVKYANGSNGEDGEKHKLIKKVVAAYGKAAHKKLAIEFPEIGDIVDRTLEKQRVRADRGDEYVEELLGAE